MTRQGAIPRAPESSDSARKQSGTRIVSIAVDQDSIPTEPANEQPRPPSVPAPVIDRYDVVMEAAPPSHEDLRDTIPSPPPDRE